MSDDRPKKSWRELDQMRDRGGGGRRKDQYERGHERATKTAAYSQYKQHLDKLFKPGGAALPEALREKLGPPDENAVARQALQAKLRDEGGAEALKAFLDAGLDLPDDPRLLMGFLDVEDEELLQPVLQSLLDIVESGKRPNRMLLIQKLDAVLLRFPDGPAAETAQLIRSALD